MPTTLSPFRYPGGKSQLYSFIENLLIENKIDGTYIEPFAGGAGLPIKLLKNDIVSNVWINDFDKSIYSVWYAILHHPNQLINKINDIPFDYYDDVSSNANDARNLEYWRTVKALYLKEKNYQTSIDNAFATLFLNRTNQSGIITGGPLGGLSQSRTKIFARLNKKTLISKINLIHSYSDRIKLTRLNALNMVPQIRSSVNQDNSFIFFDPPYYEQGNNLYYSSFDEVGHDNMSKSILSLSNYNWITTYDKSPQISELYHSAEQRFEYQIRYSANNYKRGQAPELMFASPTVTINSFNNVHLQEIK
ncbi:DNA adenine methylase [Latilactobacillus sakei]|uniref:DNA adenine methylase n=1 Tax=Latilactobacillus sakei TaxID=1599 RepID=UPI003F53396A